MRIFISLLLLILPGLALSQERTAHFADYAAYDTFVDAEIMAHHFDKVVQRMGGGDEYSPEELTEAVNGLRTVYPVDFAHAQTIRQEDLGGGFSQEARVYWTEDGGQYFYFYAFLHDRGDAVVVLSFHANSEIDQIMSRF